MNSAAIRKFLRTPKGILFLFVITFIGALALALGAAFNRPFFEKYVQEKYAPATVAEEEILKITDAAKSQKRLKECSAVQKVRLYEVWMQQPERYPAQAPAWLTASSPDSILKRVKITLTAGSEAQRKNAASFLAFCGSAAALEMLRNEHRRATVRKERDLAAHIEQYVGAASQ